MRFLSVCSGIEAASAAWHPLGWRAHAFAEIEVFPSAVLAHHYPDVPNWGDMTKFQEWPDAAIDVLVGGTPCQSFSVAGLRKGMADPRGNLALVYLGIADRYRPRWLVWENVPGVLSSNGGRDFGAFLGGLAELGYGFAYRVLDAQFFGLAQRRKRVFVVGHLGNWRRAAAVLFEPASLRGDPPPRRPEGKGFAADVVASLVSSGRGIERTGETRGQDPMIAELVTGTLQTTTHDWSRNEPGEGLIAHALRAEGFDASEDGTGRGTPLVPICFDETQITSPENRSRLEPGDPSHPLARGARPPAIAFTTTGNNGAYETGDITGWLDTNTDPSSRVIVNAWRVRRLTPRECERLQGFPDDYTAIPYRGKPAADGPRYKALGNSMAVPVMRWIGERIAAIDEIENVRAA
jgi:DNA (cytosine-5)-methyltransferase 1